MLLPAAALLWACAASPAPAPPASGRSPADSSTVVALERGPCFGTCPVYRVSVRRSGAIEFEGVRFVRDSGRVAGAMPRARVDSLLALIERSGFYGLADLYGADPLTCGRVATDLPTVIVEATAGRRHKRVEHYHGCERAPAMLSTLEGQLDSAIGTARWTGVH